MITLYLPIYLSIISQNAVMNLLGAVGQAGFDSHAWSYLKHLCNIYIYIYYIGDIAICNYWLEHVKPHPLLGKVSDAYWSGRMTR